MCFTLFKGSPAGFTLLKGFYMGIWTSRNLSNIPCRGLHSHLVPLIPYSAIAKTTLVQKPLFFTYLEMYGHFKTEIKTITTHYFKKTYTNFIIPWAIGTFLFNSTY